MVKQSPMGEGDVVRQSVVKEERADSSEAESIC